MGLDINKMIIGVLGGGVSSEREISLESAKESLDALSRKGANAIFIDINTSDKDSVKELIRSEEIDLAFIALHGEFGEDGQIQEILDELNIPYTGSGAVSSSLAMDKIKAKNIFEENNILTPTFFAWKKGEVISEDMAYPVVVKPHISGSSIGITIADNNYSLGLALEEALKHSEKVVVEAYIFGRELTVGILDEKPLAVVEIASKLGYYDFDSKYGEDMNEYRLAGDLDHQLYCDIQQQALSAHKALGCKGFSRVDMMLDKDNRSFILEVNSIPGLTTHSLLPMSAQMCGIDFDNLILKMAEVSYNGEKTQIEQ